MVISEISGRFASVVKSGRSSSCNLVRLLDNENRTFTIYCDHPSFGDILKFKRNDKVTLLVDVRIIKDFFSECDVSYNLRHFLSQTGCLKGTIYDRRNVSRLFDKLHYSFGGRRDVVEALKDYPYYAMAVSRSSRVYDYDVADKICTTLGHPIEKQCRGHCHYKIKDICEDEGHTCIPYEIYRYKITGFPGALVRNQLDALIRHKSLVCYNGMVYTSQTFNQEMTIRNFLLCDHDAVPLQPNDLLVPTLSNKQAEILELVTQSRVSILTGIPGGGKTRCVAALACAFKNIILAAPTGKAARRIVQVCREYNPKVEAFTLHSLLGIAVCDEYITDTKKQGNGNIQQNSLLIIDESSMIDVEMMFAIINSAKNYNLSLLFVGDENQLPSVGRGDVFSNLIKWGKEHWNLLELTQIHRQVETNPIYKIGQHICKGVDPECVIELVDGDTVQLITPLSYTDAITVAVELKKIYSRTPFDLQIITPWKKMASAINSKINSGKVGFRNGDYVICTNNISTADFDTFRARQRISFTIPEDPWVLQHLYKSTKIINDDGNGNFITDTIQKFEKAVNGTCGIVLNNEVIIDENSEFVYVGPNKNLANAITVHKSQGNEWATVILVLYNTGNQQYNFVNKNLLYTAMTRAKSRLIIISNQREDLFNGIKREASKRYSTDYLSTCGQFHK